MKDIDSKKIENLFETEDLHPDPLEEKTRVLKRLDLRPSPEAIAAVRKKEAEAQKINWEEKREYTRAQTEGEEIVLAFSNDKQFARQYVENISLGGLFVRTKMRPGVGAVVPIDFSVPTLDHGVRRFVLKAKVCRQTDDGLGLQFLDLTTEIRKDLEAVVKKALPEGTALSNQVKKASVDRLEKIRDEREVTMKRRWKTAKTATIIGILLIANFYMGMEVLENQDFGAILKMEQTIKVVGREISVSEIRSIGKRADGRFEIHLNGDQIIDFDLADINESILPSHLRESLRVVRSLQPAKPVRRTKNPTRNVQ